MREQAVIVGLVVLALVILIGLYKSVTEPIAELIKNITKLDCTIGFLNANFTELKENNTADHRRIWDKNNEQDLKLNDHESRIINLEKEDR